MKVNIGPDTLTFTKPVKISEFSPPHQSGIYAILKEHTPIHYPQKYRILYIGETQDYSKRGFKFHEKITCWIQNAGSWENIYISLYPTPSFSDQQRITLENTLIEYLKPPCNEI